MSLRHRLLLAVQQRGSRLATRLGSLPRAGALATVTRRSGGGNPVHPEAAVFAAVAALGGSMLAASAARWRESGVVLCHPTPDDDLARLSQTRREGYFGDPNVSSASNATGEPRIVLDREFGVGRKLYRRSMKERDPEDLAACEGRYRDKVVIVTGGAGGIGEGCVRAFFAAGSNVVICDRNEELGKKLVRDLMAYQTGTNEVFFVKTDVSIITELQELVDTTVNRYGRLDCIINNAGWHPPPKTIDEFTVDNMQDVMHLNFVSIFALCKFALPHLREVQGNIINMSSLVGHFGQANAVTYAATKGATTAFTKALAVDEAKHNVRVNSVSPGNIWTPLWKAGADAEADPAAAKRAGERVQVMGRMGMPIETGRLCLCIAADLTFTTGFDHIQSGGAEIGYGVK